MGAGGEEVTQKFLNVAWHKFAVPVQIEDAKYQVVVKSIMPGLLS